MKNKHLFSIGEISKAIGITRKIILNYETKGLITPDKKMGLTATDITPLIPLLKFAPSARSRTWAFLSTKSVNTLMANQI